MVVTARPTQKTEACLLREPPSLGDRIRALRREADALEAQQRVQLMQRITTAFPGGVFLAGQIWSQPDLRAACLDADIANTQQLGVWLRSWCGTGLDRIGRDNTGCVWSVSAHDLHQDTRVLIDEDV